MSVRVMAAVWRLEAVTATDKLVLLKLADCSDDNGRNAFPSQKTIARQCGMKDRTVRLSLTRLLSRGYPMTLESEL